MLLEGSYTIVQPDEIVKNWVHLAAHDHAHKRRVDSRYPFIRAATVTQGAQQQQDAICRDISLRGIGVLHRHPVQIGEPTTIEILVNTERVSTEVQVLWSKEAGRGWWLTGGHFERSSLGYASTLCSTIKTEVERRRHNRYPFFQPLCLFDPASSSEEAKYRVFSIDISLGGLSLLSDTPISEQQVLIRISQTNNYIKAKIVRSEPTPHGFGIYGLAFDSDVQDN